MICFFRNQENEQMQELAGSTWNSSVRVAKTSEDHYARSDSSSSQSSADVPIQSPKSNPYNAPTGHPQMIKPDLKRVFILLCNPII